MAAMFVLSVNVSAEEFALNFTSSTQINHDFNDWVTAAATTQYELQVNKTSIASGESVVSIHTVTEFYPPDGIAIQQLNVPIKRIYSYGIMECKNSIFHLLNDWFVDKTGQIVYSQSYEIGSYEVDLSAKNTPRNDLFLLICTPKSQ